MSDGFGLDDGLDDDTDGQAGGGQDSDGAPGGGAGQDPTQPQPGGAGTTEQDPAGARRQEFDDLDAWVRGWFAPCVSMRLTGEGRGLTWCSVWWEHTAVGVRLHALWQAWETTLAGNDDAAMARWWVQLAEPMLRIVCNGETGPMWQCTPDHHHPSPTLPTIPAPAGWFDTGGGQGPQLSSGAQR